MSKLKGYNSREVVTKELELSSKQLAEVNRGLFESIPLLVDNNSPFTNEDDKTIKAKMSAFKEFSTQLDVTNLPLNDKQLIKHQIVNAIKLYHPAKLSPEEELLINKNIENIKNGDKKTRTWGEYFSEIYNKVVNYALELSKPKELKLTPPPLPKIPAPPLNSAPSLPPMPSIKAPAVPTKPLEQNMSIEIAASLLPAEQEDTKMRSLVHKSRQQTTDQSYTIMK